MKKTYISPIIKSTAMTGDEAIMAGSTKINLGNGTTGTVSDEDATKPAGSNSFNVWDDPEESFTPDRF